MSEGVYIRSVGTPQGWIISQMSFNLASFTGLPSILQTIEGLHHATSPDITLWISNSSDGLIEQQLKEATDTVKLYLEGSGRACPAKKSELLLHKQK